MIQEHRHILFLTPGFPENEADTTCLTYFQNYLLHLHKSASNLQITVVSFHYPFLKTAYEWNTIKVISLGGANKKHVHKIALWWRAIQVIRQLHEISPVHLIHSLWLKECTLVGDYMARRLKLAHLCTAMGTEVLKGDNHFLKILNLSKIPVVAVSDFQKEHLRQSFPKAAIETIPWGIEETVDVQLKPYEEREIDVLGVGSLMALKDYASFIRIIKKLVIEKPNLVVRIIGDGPQRKLLEQQIKQFGLEKTIELMGQIDNQTVQEYMQNSKVFLHTSTFESQGYVFSEALLHGMKIVSRKVGTAEESDYWYIGKEVADLSHKTNLALTYFKPKKNVLYSMTKTVETYGAWYQKVSNL